MALNEEETPDQPVDESTGGPAAESSEETTEETTEEKPVGSSALGLDERHFGMGDPGTTGQAWYDHAGTQPEKLR